jgi:hypothetical protein
MTDPMVRLARIRRRIARHFAEPPRPPFSLVNLIELADDIATGTLTDAELDRIMQGRPMAPCLVEFLALIDRIDGVNDAGEPDSPAT